VLDGGQRAVLSSLALLCIDAVAYYVLRYEPVVMVPVAKPIPKPIRQPDSIPVPKPAAKPARYQNTLALGLKFKLLQSPRFQFSNQNEAQE
jgi:hypothetical protein